jgi:hypothetical protein
MANANDGETPEKQAGSNQVARPRKPHRKSKDSLPTLQTRTGPPQNLAPRRSLLYGLARKNILPAEESPRHARCGSKPGAMPRSASSCRPHRGQVSGSGARGRSSRLRRWPTRSRQGLAAEDADPVGKRIPTLEQRRHRHRVIAGEFFTGRKRGVYCQRCLVGQIPQNQGLFQFAIPLARCVGFCGGIGCGCGRKHRHG